ncbi:MAG: N-6 DNA methylase [Planctomycetaceae bacterium]|nr:N-6 DNA methylase [Planctomycetaceae bacterium]
MSIARHHAEWLSLVPVSGPFLSLPVLLDAFPQGLDAHDPDHARLLRLAYSQWDENFDRRRPDPATHGAWIKFVLTKTLEFDEDLLVEGQSIPQTLHVELPEHSELLKPNIVVNDPATKKPRLLVQTCPRSQELTSYVVNSPWKASPDTRMTELLHATGVRLGLVTNGEHWMLVDAPKGETTGYASWYASLWLEEYITLRAFRTLLSAPRFFGVADNETIEALLTKSASNQQEVTDQLGYQVRRAVEVLIQSLDRADQDYGRELLAGVSPEVLYESALTVMMRLVFLFCAEERELIPTRPFPVYEQNYSVSTISKQLRELADQHGEELLERRHDAWPRLLTAFRIVFGGIRHDEINVPAYGGRLFDPDRFPFLEGRKQGTNWRDTDATPLPVNNRTVLHLLEALQLLQVKVPGGGPAEARRLSFRALDIEQIGHVYEGLLDHTAKRATEPFLGLAGTRDKEPEILLADLEKMRDKGEDAFLKYLKDETGRSVAALKKALDAEIDGQDAAKFRTVCQGDDELWQRVEPLAKLVRPDTFGYPVVIPKGSVFVTAGTDRRSSGTHYTPRSLTEPIVQYTLEPLVYVGPAEGKPKAEWKLKSAKELLDLKICDMACGSGAFLVQADRYMAERLLEAWDAAKQANPKTPGITPEGEPSTGKPNEVLIPDDPNERKTYAMRIIAQRCLYGVDVNPLAADMAKLSLWLLTVAKDKPFEFLDHAIRCGDSLVGLHDIDQLRHFSLKPDKDDTPLFKGPLDGPVNEAIKLRLRLEDMPANSVEDVEAQEKLLKEANDKIARLRCAADLLVAADFWGETARDKQEKVRHAAVVVGKHIENGSTEEFQEIAAKERLAQLMFHWPLEFPEVIVKRGGFDAFVGNPPFMGGLKLETAYGGHWRNYVVDSIANGVRGLRGTADLCSYFLLRTRMCLRDHADVGLITTNSISEGDTREVGLQQLVGRGVRIIRAYPSNKWPGDANLEVALVWLRDGEWHGPSVLDDKAVANITPRLAPYVETVGEAHRLAQCKDRAFMGATVLGVGFTMSPDDASQLISQDDKNRSVLFPHVNGDDINSRPDCSPSRWIINFFNWPLEQAEDFALCIEWLRKKVKPEREALMGRNAVGTRRATYWWRYAQDANTLFRTIEGMKRVLVKSGVSKYHAFAFLPTGFVPSHAVFVFAFQDYGSFGVLQSSIHESWTIENSSSLETRLRYTPMTCFETFVFPRAVSNVEDAGRRFYELRSDVMLARQEGLTKTYNRFHDPDETSTDIQKLRELHVEMDQAVAAAYGWTDLDLGHGFHETKQGLRFTISEPARREVLQRLLKLNHERYAEEVKQGLHGKTGGKRQAAPKETTAKRSIRTKAARQGPPLFDKEGNE